MARRLPEVVTNHPVVTIVILICLGSLLLLVSGRLMQQSPVPLSSPVAEPRPSPTWRAMPTRAPQRLVDPTHTDMAVFHRALLKGDLDQAQKLWTEMMNADQDVDGELYQAGARLALLQGKPATAVERAWHAVGGHATSAQAWSLLGIALRSADAPRQAEQALAIAVEFDPTLSPHLFNDRWRAALSANAATTLSELAQDFALQYPESDLLPYYRAEALIAADSPLDAIELLVAVLAEDPAAPALLWYTLGRGYLEYGGYTEAAYALEAAAMRLYQGDTSLDMISQNSLTDLSIALGHSYIGSERCREAEAIFRRLQEDNADLTPLVQAAVLCQTPTPTLTPWIPKQIGTVTPRP